MNIYRFAINMELDGKKYYEKLMNEAKDEGLKKVFEMLAKDEEEHEKIINEMEEIDKGTVRSKVLNKVNNIFIDMLHEDKKFDLTASSIEAYKHAIELENKSMKLYEEYYEKAENEKEKKIFKKLAEEEKKHKLIIENILDFVVKPERDRGVKTVDSDPEFARFEYEE